MRAHNRNCGFIRTYVPFADALQNRCSEKLWKFHKKKPVLESLFNKAVDFQVCNFIKRGANTGAVL